MRRVVEEMWPKVDLDGNDRITTHEFSRTGGLADLILERFRAIGALPESQEQRNPPWPKRPLRSPSKSVTTEPPTDLSDDGRCDFPKLRERRALGFSSSGSQVLARGRKNRQQFTKAEADLSRWAKPLEAADRDVEDVIGLYTSERGGRTSSKRSSSKQSSVITESSAVADANSRSQSIDASIRSLSPWRCCNPELRSQEKSSTLLPSSATAGATSGSRPPTPDALTRRLAAQQHPANSRRRPADRPPNFKSRARRPQSHEPRISAVRSDGDTEKDDASGGLSSATTSAAGSRQGSKASASSPFSTGRSSPSHGTPSSGRTSSSGRKASCGPITPSGGLWYTAPT
jgi:hypothetical protein